ncbi:MAG: restriction endonuclease subunit S [Saccharofermentanales bacterium]|jgi:type I restriction enzyme S subunit
MTPQELKNSILQLAIQGKLVEQRVEEGTGEELYQQIQAEKQKLIKEGKIKEEKPLPEIAEDEITFDIPESWKWVHLNEIATSGLGKTLNKAKDTGDMCPYLCSINVYWSGISLDTIKEARFTEDDKKKYLLQKGDLLICEGGDVGRSSVWEEDAEMYYQNALHRVRFYGELEPYYFKFLLEFYKAAGILDEYSKGMTIKHLVQSALHSMWLPLPPLAEQKRIVEKIEEFFPYIDRYEEAWSKLEDFNERFPEDMQKSLLQYAIQGKLVEQREEEGTGEELHQQILEEKARLIKKGEIKKKKPLPEITKDEIPFDIPESWKWTRWGNVINIVSARRVHQSDWKSQGVPFYRAREIAKLGEDGYVDNELFISQELFDEFSKTGVPKPGDLMVTAVGTLGKTYIVKPEDHFYYKDASVICFENYGNIFPEYLKHAMQSEMMMSQIRSNSGGTTVATLTMVRMAEYLLPLPPLAEQKRIVAKLEELLLLCDRLS